MNPMSSWGKKLKENKSGQVFTLDEAHLCSDSRMGLVPIKPTS
jgi:hypothetical protein